MMRPRQSPISNERINRELTSPEAEKRRRELSELARGFDEEMAEATEPEENLLPPGRMQNKEPPTRGGPLSNRDKEKRIRETRVPPPRMDRQAFNPDMEPETDQAERVIEDLGPITNRDNRLNSGPQVPPSIPEVDLLKKQLKDQQTQLEALQRRTDSPIETKDPKPPANLASRRKKYNAKYTGIIPASQGVFYDFPIDNLRVKRIDVDIQRSITMAKTAGDVSLLIDAVGATLEEPIDIRDLTNEDWFHLLYYHLFASYPKSSFTLNWTSKYGNDNAYTISQSDITYINPGITKQEYQENFYKMGVCVPTLRDWELLNTDNHLSAEDKDIYFRAQWYVGNTMEEKVDNYFEYGETLDHTYLVDELKARSVHGVRNTVEVIDAHYNQKVYTSQRRDYLESLKVESLQYKDNAALYSVYRAEIEELNTEVEDLETKLRNGEQVRAEVETQPVRFRALDIFPFL
jgi:hypothetical protein